MKKQVVLALALPVCTVLGIAAFVNAATAQDGGTSDAKEPVSLIATYELMDILFDPAFGQLKEAVASEPTDRRGWVTIYRSANALGELANLLFAHEDEEYMTTDDYKTMIVDSRKAAGSIVASVRQQNFDEVKQNYMALVQSCNACHEKFAADVAPVLEP